MQGYYIYKSVSTAFDNFLFFFNVSFGMISLDGLNVKLSIKMAHIGLLRTTKNL